MTEPVVQDVAPAPRSSALCAAWASPADIPETYRDTLSDERWEAVLLMASEILWGLSGRRWYGSGCTETATYRDETLCWEQHVDTGGGNYWRIPERWSNPGSQAIKLPRSYVSSVTAVTVNGQPFTAYQLEPAGGLLYRTDGCSWAGCFNGPISVTYVHGEAPPEGGVQAAVALAVEFALAENNDGRCTLPQRVQSITRQGISMTMMDPMDLLEAGHTGVYLVDLWLTTVNPHKRAQNGRVWNPDVARLRRFS